MKIYVKVTANLAEITKCDGLTSFVEMRVCVSRSSGLLSIRPTEKVEFINCESMKMKVEDIGDFMEIHGLPSVGRETLL